MKFDGKAFANKIEQNLIYKVRNLVKKPKIVSVLVGSDPASALYTKLKKAAAERVGVNFDIVKIDSDKFQVESLSSVVKEIGAREDVTGVMIQLPLPGVSRKDTEQILQAIPLSKDVDGLRYPESKIVPPVVKAILDVINEIEKTQSSKHSPMVAQGSELRLQKYVVIGASGFVGSATCRELEASGKTVIKVDSDTVEPTKRLLEGDVVISCTGKEGIVTGEMIKDAAIVIDVGAPRGDMTREVYEKASVSVEVPGGIGPVTIACLMENGIEVEID